MKKKRYLILLLLALTTVVICILIIKKKIKIAPIFAGRYEVIGVDVSHYQGSIDWEKLAGQNLDFAFIKATEGSSHIDECFYDNWKEAGKTGLYIGAYHFFSFDSDGSRQAQFYIDTVGDLSGKIAPVVDVEFYGDKEKNPPGKDEVVEQLSRMLETLEEYYQVKPVIYTTYKVYNAYIKDAFEEYPLWIRNVYYQPLITAGKEWIFWQYTDTAVLEGYQGTEKYIDMNVFRGTREELEKLTVQCENEVPSEEKGAENSKEYKSRDEVFAAIEDGDFSVVASNYSDLERIVESLEMGYESDGDVRRFERCDIDGDGFDELLFLIQYEFEDYERIDFILDYRNGSAVCIYYDWCDGNEWLSLGNAGQLIHCSYSNNGSCTYYGFYECTLNAKGIKDIDYTGYGIEVCDVYESGESGLWWWSGQQPEITQTGVYYTKVRAKSAEEINDTGTADGWVKELITKEQFDKEYKELTGKDFE